MFNFSENKINQINSVVVYLLYFLTPLTFVFATRELFEFPKMILVYFLALVIFCLYILRFGLRPRQGKVLLTNPLVVLIGANLVSTVFSVNRYTSIFGYYSRFNGGLLSLVGFAVIFFCLGRTLNRKLSDLVLTAMLSSGTLVSFYALLQNFGFDKNLWVQDSQARTFSTLGQPNWLSAYLLVILPIPLYFYLNEKTSVKKWFFFGLTVLFYFAFWSTYSLSGFLGFTALVCLILFGSRQIIFNKWREIILLGFVCLMVSILRPGIFGAKIKSFLEIIKPVISFSHEALAAPASATNSALTSPALKSIDTGDIRLAVWPGALKLWLSSPKNFLIGTGPETFAYTFLPFRPLPMNKTTEWDFLYNKAHNYYLDLLCGTGILGLLAYLFFSFSVVKKVISASGKDPLSLPRLMLYGWATIFVTNAFGWPTVVLSLLFFTYPIIMSRLPNEEKPENESVTQKNISLSRGLLVLVFFVPLALGVSNIFLADVSFSQGYGYSQSGETLAAENNLKDAVNLNPWEPAYHKELSYNYAQKYVESNDETDLNFALKETKTAYNLNPKNSLTLRSLIRVYYLISKVRPEYKAKLENLSLEIIKLSPSEPRSYYDAALMFYYSQKNDEAKKLLATALALKPDYPEALDLSQKLATPSVKMVVK